MITKMLTTIATVLTRYQVSDAPAGTSMVGGAAPPRSPAAMARETVTVPWTGEPMMVTEDVRQAAICCNMLPAE